MWSNNLSYTNQIKRKTKIEYSQPQGLTNSLQLVLIKVLSIIWHKGFSSEGGINLPLLSQGNMMDYTITTAWFLQMIVIVTNARDAGFLAEGVR